MSSVSLLQRRKRVSEGLAQRVPLMVGAMGASEQMRAIAIAVKM